MDYTHCTLCPRRCGVDRTAGERGFCGMGDTLRIARAAVHYGEEPAIAGSFGAGAVFFSGCSLGCVYCQNEEVSHGGLGKDVSPQRLREIFLELIDQGVQCIDLVTPTHFLPSLLPALSPKLEVPVVYNCGGYETVETIKALEGLVDVYLPDMKYSDAVLAGRLSRAPDYPEVAMAAIREMVRQTGPFQMEDGVLTRGVLVRHLILPGQVVQAKPRSQTMVPFQVAAAGAHRDVLPNLPEYLDVQLEKLRFELVRRPKRAEVPITCDVQLVVEHYSR